MKTINIHITDKSVIIKNNKLSILKTSINHGKIDNLKIFMKEIKQELNNLNINKSIIGDKCIIVVNDLYTDNDINNLKTIFKDLEFSSVEIIKESSLIKDNIFIIDEQSIRIFQDEIIINHISLLNKIKKIYNLQNKLIINYKDESIPLKEYYLIKPYNYFIDINFPLKIE